MPVLSRKVSQKIFYDQKHMLFQHFLKIMIQMLHSKRLKKIYSLKNWRVLDGRREMSTACGTLKCTADSSTEHSHSCDLTVRHTTASVSFKISEILWRQWSREAHDWLWQCWMKTPVLPWSCQVDWEETDTSLRSTWRLCHRWFYFVNTFPWTIKS